MLTECADRGRVRAVLAVDAEPVERAHRAVARDDAVAVHARDGVPRLPDLVDGHRARRPPRVPGRAGRVDRAARCGREERGAQRIVSGAQCLFRRGGAKWEG